MRQNYLVLVMAAVLFGAICQAVPTTLSIVSTSESPTAFADNAADTVNGNQVRNANCDVVLLFHNSHATNASTVAIAPSSATFNIPGYGPMGKTAASVVLAAGAKKHIGPFPCSTWNTSGYVTMTYTGTGTVLITPIRVPAP